MSSIIGMLQPAIILFCVVVAPIWIVMHYRHKSKETGTGKTSESERQKIESLLALADKMEDRIETLESILDTQNPSWRTHP
ncbi:envelope stress response membrane protein PspB [Teredinibacter waterburyi]|jgi:phage shock protein B|uniref:envelope stress response membrane protein PspB n=1 Tax=Teredinibacter waterburyi TaxID=1500538 RepID=UPI00165FF481|nr:envelope stress response membrane protein PspB [Teredinibacter waterburyi]